MQFYRSFLLVISLQILSFQAVSATNISQCQDDQGNISFQEYCPPDMLELSRKSIATDKSDQENKGIDVDVTLYMIPDCEACIEVKEFLQLKDIVFEEKDVSESIPLQEELTKVAGALSVPVTVIGEQVVKGYQRSQMEEIIAKYSGSDGEDSGEDSADIKSTNQQTEQ